MSYAAFKNIFVDVIIHYDSVYIALGKHLGRVECLRYIQEKYRHSCISFDIPDFYQSLSENLLEII